VENPPVANNQFTRSVGRIEVPRAGDDFYQMVDGRLMQAAQKNSPARRATTVSVKPQPEIRTSTNPSYQHDFQLGNDVTKPIQPFQQLDIFFSLE
jgi:hypothetical protein